MYVIMYCFYKTQIRCKIDIRSGDPGERGVPAAPLPLNSADIS